MSSQEDRSELIVAAGVLAVVVFPCFIACAYHLALGHPQTALLYAVPSICCGLLYLGLLWLWDLRSALEAGLFAFIVCNACLILVPVAIKLHTKHHVGGAGTAHRPDALRAGAIGGAVSPRQNGTICRRMRRRRPHQGIPIDYVCIGTSSLYPGAVFGNGPQGRSPKRVCER